MAEKDFFDLFKEKMATLRPSARHRDADWALLATRLDHTLPRQPYNLSRIWLPILLLLLLLLSSNAFWWRQSRIHDVAMHRLEVQLAGLHTSISVLKSSDPIVRIDTAWRTVYIDIPGVEQFARPLPEEITPNKLRSIRQQNSIEKKILSSTPTTDTNSKRVETTNEILAESNRTVPSEIVSQPGSFDFGKDSMANIIKLLPLETYSRTSLKSTRRQPQYTPKRVITAEMESNPRPFGGTLLNSLKPKYFRIGVVAGWLHPVSPVLMHQSGFETGIQGSVEFPRHWSVVLEYMYGELHYQSTEPAAILGSPGIPELSSPDERFNHLNLKRQSFRQFGLGARYSFFQPGKIRPFIGINWSNQTLMPYTVEYEIKHEPSNAVRQGLVVVEETSHLKNVLRFSAGLGIPVSRRFDLTIEGFYMRQCIKRNNEILDMMGIRGGINWVF